MIIGTAVMSVAPVSSSEYESAAQPTSNVSILCLCLGNICRSPLAEGVVRRQLQRRKLDGWRVDSAGTASYHVGDHPDDRSIAVAAQHGIDISSHRGQQLTKEHWRKFDFILAMDSSNYRNALAIKPDNSRAQLMMYLPKGDVPDPWYGDDSNFRDCYDLLNQHVDDVLDRCVAAVKKS